MKKATVLVLLAVVALTVVPLILKSGKAEFGGADAAGQAAITQIDPGYKPWFSSVWQPSSSAVANLMFALQGAIGAGLVLSALGYFVGRARGRAQAAAEQPPVPAERRRRVATVALVAVVALAAVPAIRHSGWTPPSGEIVNLLSALQGASIAGLIFSALGYFVGRAKGRAQGAAERTPVKTADPSRTAASL